VAGICAEEELLQGLKFTSLAFLDRIAGMRNIAAR
jgi:hypothetical protein